MSSPQAAAITPPRIRLQADDITTGNLDQCFSFIKPFESIRRAGCALRWLYTSEMLPELPAFDVIISDEYFIDSTTLVEEVHYYYDDDPMQITLVLNTDWLSSFMENDEYNEFIGVLVFYISSCMLQDYPRGLSSGLADYVRLREGLAPPHWERNDSESWLDGFHITAYFLDFLEKNKGEGTVHNIIAFLQKNPLDEDSNLEDIIGEAVGVNILDAWEEYQNSQTYDDGDDEPTQSEFGIDKEDEDEDDSLSSTDWPIPKFHLLIKDLKHRGAKVFQDTTDASEVLQEAVMATFVHLYTLETVPRNVKHITLILRSMSEDDVIYNLGSKSHKEIHLSLEYIEDQDDLAREELLGLLIHEVTLCYQSHHPSVPPGLTQGIADFVRLQACLVPDNWHQHADGEWDAGKETTAYFLEWIDSKFGGSTISKLNFKCNSGDFSEEVVRDLTGHSVGELWEEYGIELREKEKSIKQDGGDPDDLEA